MNVLYGSDVIGHHHGNNPGSQKIDKFPYPMCFAFKFTELLRHKISKEKLSKSIYYG